MARPLCSVIFCTYQRAHLLARSVECYNRSKFPLDRLEVVVVDDGSTDETAKVCERFDPAVDVKYIKLRKPDGLWRDGAKTLNVGIRAAFGSAILLTHPEVMPGRESIAQFCDHVKDGNYTCLKPYYLTARDQERLDTVDWINEGPLAVRKIEGFYDREQHKDTHQDYTPWSIEAVGRPDHNVKVWESWVIGGHTRKTFKNLGGFFETERWGSVDLLYHARRQILGIQNVTLTDDQTICVHQNHDAPRSLEAAHTEASTFNMNPAALLYPTVDYLW